MKIAVAGKGGVGKSTIAGTVARLLARSGHSVVALDCDPSPNVGIPLGLSHEDLAGIRPVLNMLVDSGHTHHDPKPDPEDLLRRLHTMTPDGVMLLATGEVVRRSDACMCCGSHASTRSLFSDLAADDRIVVADLEAGLNDLLWARPAENDTLLAVAEPTVKSVEIAARVCRIGRALGVTRILAVANRCARPEDAAHLEAAVGVPVLSVPEDPALAEADRLGAAPLDVDPSSPAMTAIAVLTDRLVEPLTAPAGRA